MAVTKLLRIKENMRSGNKSAGLKRCIEYICNPEKTAGGTLIGGTCGSTPELIYAEMRANKLIWAKESGSQGYHYVIAFQPEEDVTEELALKVSEDFCRELLGDNYLYTIAVHNDKNHIHSHIVFDSVSVNDGSMYHSGIFDWHERIQPITDKICRKYGLQTLQYDTNRERIGMFHGEWEQTKRASVFPPVDVSWSDIVRQDIDDALRMSESWGTFLEVMTSRHYRVRDGKYLSVQPEGREHAIRTSRLGSGYTKEALMERLAHKEREEVNHPYQICSRPDTLYRVIRSHYAVGKSLSPMEKRFFIKWMKLAHSRRPDFLHSWRYRKAVTNLGKMARAYQYMLRHDLTDYAAVTGWIEQLRQKEASLVRERIRIRNKQRDLPLADSDRLAGIRTELAEIRKEEKLCKSILEEKMSDQILFEQGSLDVTVPEGDYYTRITVNESLFMKDIKDEDGIAVRLPGTSQVVLLIKDDSRYLNDENMLSSYIYYDLSYPILDTNGEPVRTISGKELAGHFIDRTRRKQR